MKYTKIILSIIILLSFGKNISASRKRNLKRFLSQYGNSRFSFMNLSLNKFDELEENKFRNTKFWISNFDSCRFKNFNLLKTVFNKSIFYNAIFFNMELENTTFYKCYFSNTCFINCKQRGSKFILCKGLTETNKHTIEKNGGMVIEKIIKVKSSEEYWEKVIEYQQKGIYDRVLIDTKGPSILSKIKNKISRTIDTIYKISMLKTLERIQNIYS